MLKHNQLILSIRLIQSEEMSPRQVAFKQNNVNVEADYEPVDYAKENFKSCACGKENKTNISMCADCRRKRCMGVRVLNC